MSIGPPIYVLTESMDVISTKILKALKEEINTEFSKTSFLLNIEARLKELTADYLQNTPEYKALTEGELVGQFGFYKGTQYSKVNNIINQAIQQVRVEFIPIVNITRSGFYSGGLRIYIIEADFKKIIDSNESHIITEKEYDLHWLKWLLLDGNKIIIDTHYFHPTGYSTSRSGRGLMYENKSKVEKYSRGWRIPPQYSGTIKKNWFTRALINNKEIFELYAANIIELEIKRSLYG